MLTQQGIFHGRLCWTAGDRRFSSLHWVRAMYNMTRPITCAIRPFPATRSRVSLFCGTQLYRKDRRTSYIEYETMWCFVCGLKDCPLQEKLCLKPGADFKRLWQQASDVWCADTGNTLPIRLHYFLFVTQEMYEQNQHIHDTKNIFKTTKIVFQKSYFKNDEPITLYKKCTFLNSLGKLKNVLIPTYTSLRL